MSVISNRTPIMTGQYTNLTYRLSFVSIKGMSICDAKAIEFKETARIVTYIIRQKYSR